MKSKIIFTVIIAFTALVSCNNAFVTEILPDRSRKTSQLQNGAYKIEINISGNESGDKVTASPESGDEGDTVTLTYTVANTAHYNLLDIGGVSVEIASADSAGNGERTYTIDPADASSGIITITAVFSHTNLIPDPIVFTDTEDTESRFCLYYR